LCDWVITLNQVIPSVNAFLLENEFQVALNQAEAGVKHLGLIEIVSTTYPPS
jgi:hypothetical protein